MIVTSIMNPVKAHLGYTWIKTIKTRLLLLLHTNKQAL